MACESIKQKWKYIKLNINSSFSIVYHQLHTLLLVNQMWNES